MSPHTVKMLRLQGEDRSHVGGQGGGPGCGRERRRTWALLATLLCILSWDTLALGGASSPGIQLGPFQNPQLISCDKFQVDPTPG